MDTKDIIKKYWFVGLVAVLLIVFVAVYAVDLNKNKEVKVDTLTKDGMSVIYSIDDNDYYFADDLYNDLSGDLKANAALNSYILSVCREGVETTTEMTNYAASYAQYVLSSNDEATIASQLRQYGYDGTDDLTTYCIDMLKQQEVIKQYLLDNYDVEVEPKLADINPRKISHILIKVADVTESTDENGNTIHTANPTAEEQAKLDEVLKALETKNFEEVAKEYSEDSSAAIGGLIGIVDENTKSNYVAEFADASMNLNYGEVSDVITTTYGWHIIKCDEATKDELCSDSGFQSSLADNSLFFRAICAKADELGYTVSDSDLQAQIDSLLSTQEAE